MVQFKHGAHQSKQDPRDFLYGDVVVKTGGIPSSKFFDRIPVKNQGNFGICVGEAASYIKQIQDVLDGEDNVFSELFIYDECKTIDGNTNEGTEPRAAMQVLSTLGACREAAMPLSLLADITKLPTPSKVALDDAAKYKISNYARLQSLDDIKHALQTSPVLGAVLVTDGFVNCEPGGYVKILGNLLGGHGICIDGYDDNLTVRYSDGNTYTGFLRFVNSWDITWGDKGYGYIPYALFDAKVPGGYNFVQEAWASVDLKPQTDPNTAPVATMTLNKKQAEVNGQPVVLSQAPIVINGNLLVPFDEVADSLGYDVTFDKKSKQIEFFKKQ